MSFAPILDTTQPLVAVVLLRSGKQGFGARFTALIATASIARAHAHRAAARAVAPWPA